jgi:hypothetical protein
MTEMIASWLTVLQQALAVIPQEGWVILLCAVFGFLGTQVVKRRRKLDKDDILLAALGISALPGMLFWPGDRLVGLFVGVSVGCANYLAYKPIVRKLYQLIPDLEDKLSARPTIKVMENGDLGIKHGDDKTRPLTKEERAEIENTLGRK